MKHGGQFLLLVMLLMLAASRICTGSPQESAKPLSERELVYLLEKGVSASALAYMVEQYGVSLVPNEATFERLRKSGAQETLIESIRRRTSPLTLTIEGVPLSAAESASQVSMQQASHHLELGKQKMENRDYEGAFQEFAEAERIQPRWHEIFLHRGMALAALGRHSEAAAEWRKALPVAPAGADRERIRRNIAEWEGQAQKRETMLGLVAQGNEQLLHFDAEGAGKSFEEAVKLGRSVGNLLHLARAHLLQGDYEALAETASQALALDPQSAQALLYRAAAELKLGYTDKAIGALEQALALNPSLAYGYALLGAAVGRKAGQVFWPTKQTQPGGIDSTSAEARNRLGWVLWNGGSFQQALEEFRRAAEVDPTNAAWYCDLAYARNVRGDTLGAVAAAREAVRLDQESACGHHALGLALEKRGRGAEASREFQEVLDLSAVPNPGDLYRLMRGGQPETRDEH